MSDSYATILQSAIRLHQQGQLVQAESLYRNLLATRPDDPMVLNGLGACLAQRGFSEAAIPMLEHALRCLPDARSAAPCLANLGNALQQEGRLADALSAFEAALRGMPNHPDLLANRGNVLRLLDRHDEALSSYTAAMRYSPGSPTAAIGRGSVLERLGRYEAALADMETALRHAPGDVVAHYNRGAILKKMGRMAEARAALERTCELGPGHFDAFIDLGLVCCVLEQWEAALRAFDHALALRHGSADAYAMRAAAFQGMGNLARSLEDYERALSAQPSHGPALLGQADVLRGAGRYAAAAQSYELAIKAAPEQNESGRAHLHAASCYLMLGERRACREHLERFERILLQMPAGIEAAKAHTAAGTCYLLLGDLLPGWKHMEWRWRGGSKHPIHPWPMDQTWLGHEDPSGMRIFVHAEQGLGDTLQFCRYLPLLARRGARISLLVQEPIRSLVRSMDGLATMLLDDDLGAEFDRHIPLLSLPLAFGTQLDTIPDEVPYLRVPHGQSYKWEDRLGARLAPRIGIAWCGSATHDNDANRSIALDEFAPLVESEPGKSVQWISLQKDVREGDLARATQLGVHHFGDMLGDFSDTAGLMEQLDLVISVDTSVAHLAGALGRPVWILLPNVPDWRWMLERSDSPWYPSARLFRQSEPRNWHPVIHRVKEELVAWYERFFKGNTAAKRIAPDAFLVTGRVNKRTVSDS